MHLYDKNFIYYNQTSIQHFLQDQVHIEYFTCDKLNIQLTSISMVLHTYSIKL